MPATRPSRIAACEGDRCVGLLDCGDDGRPRLVAALGRLAARLRAEGRLGRLVLVDTRTGKVVAARPIWP